jgi:hypothetical protein
MKKPADQQWLGDFDDRADDEIKAFMKKHTTFLRPEDFEGFPPSVWAPMMDLIYQGNAETAWQYLDKHWPAGVDGKALFRTVIMDQLKTSPYWEAIKELNGL